MGQWQQGAKNNYPQLAITIIFLLLLIPVLPSVLNLPVTNPNETLEYAPVPPDSNAPPSTGSNLASLGLGSTSSFLAEPPALSELVGGGRGARPSTKRCVGNPPRQTADPLSPPCVAFFDGDNFGSTYLGVSREEIRVLIRVETDVGQCGHFKGCQTRPRGQYHDLALPETPDDYYQDVYLRNWQRYFNEHYQTYGRFVHFYAHYHGEQLANPEQRRALAADHYSKVKPFAVVFDANAPDNLSAYQDVASKRGMVVYSGGIGLSAETFSKYPKLAWGFMPSAQQQAKVFADYICRKVVPHRVSYSGPELINRTRKFGLVYNREEEAPQRREYKDEVVRLLGEQCGLTFVTDDTHAYARDNIHSDPSYANEGVEAMNRFENQRGITTIIWPMGYETNMSKAAEAANYFPEWIVSGDGFNDGSWPQADQAQSVWEHAINITPTTRLKPNGQSQTCEDAYTEVHPEIPRDGFDLFQTCVFYPALRQLFIGIQVAGPRLGPTSMDKGYRAIPPTPSLDPQTPACYYVPGDQTCVKDAQMTWWDAQSDNTQGEISGCWRMMLGGQRFLQGGWPGGNIHEQISGGDQCNGYVAGFGAARVGSPPT